MLTFPTQYAGIWWLTHHTFYLKAHVIAVGYTVVRARDPKSALCHVDDSILYHLSGQHAGQHILVDGRVARSENRWSAKKVEGGGGGGGRYLFNGRMHKY